MRRSRNDMTPARYWARCAEKESSLHRMPGGHRANPGAGERIPAHGDGNRVTAAH